MITSNCKIQSIFTFYTRCRAFSEGTILFRAWDPDNPLMNIQNRVLSSVSGRIASSRFVADWLLIVIVYAVAGLLW